MDGKAVHRAAHIAGGAASVVEACASNDTIACLTKLEQNIDASSKQLAKLLQHQRDAHHTHANDGHHRPADHAQHQKSCDAFATTLGHGFRAKYQDDRCDVVYHAGKQKCFQLVSYTPKVPASDTDFGSTKTVQDALRKCGDGCDSVYFASNDGGQHASLNFSSLAAQHVDAHGHGAYVFRKVDCG